VVLSPTRTTRQPVEGPCRSFFLIGTFLTPVFFYAIQYFGRDKKAQGPPKPWPGRVANPHKK
jgi:hypothetical protein